MSNDKPPTQTILKGTEPKPGVEPEGMIDPKWSPPTPQRAPALDNAPSQGRHR